MAYEIDWSATGDMLQGIGSILGVLAVVGASLIGRSTFQNWKEQTIAEKNISYAEKILVAVYKVRRQLTYVRNPMMLPHEFVAAKAKLIEKERWEELGPEDQKKHQTLFAYYQRLEDALPARIDLEECYAFARAFFGEDLELKLAELNQYFGRVQVAAQYQCGFRGDEPEEFVQSIELTLWSEMFKDEVGDNPHDKAIVDLLTSIEERLVPVLSIRKRGAR